MIPEDNYIRMISPSTSPSLGSFMKLGQKLVCPLPTLYLLCAETYGNNHDTRLPLFLSLVEVIELRTYVLCENKHPSKSPQIESIFEWSRACLLGSLWGTSIPSLITTQTDPFLLCRPLSISCQVHLTKAFLHRVPTAMPAQLTFPSQSPSLSSATLVASSVLQTNGLDISQESDVGSTGEVLTRTLEPHLCVC